MPDWEREIVVLREARGTLDAWSLFAERMKLVNGTPIDSVRGLADYLAQHNYLHGYCDPNLWPKLAPAFEDRSGFKIEHEFDRTRVDDYQFGITAADGAIAETGTLILSDELTSRRLGALAPWVHVAAVKRARIFLDVPAAITALPKDPNVVWCTGPSKTADVEGILIEGVHGPGVQIALLLD